jgi:hypothetical protein
MRPYQGVPLKKKERRKERKRDGGDPGFSNAQAVTGFGLSDAVFLKGRPMGRRWDQAQVTQEGL